MFLLILVMTSICRLGEATLFENHPVDTLALKGSRVTLSCTLQNNVWCHVENSYRMYWKRGMTMESNTEISDLTTVYASTVGNERYMVTRSGCRWTFHIRYLKPKDEGYYSCYVYRYQPEQEFEDSNVARLVVGPIDTTVIPSQIGRHVGQNATFRCQTRPTIEYELTYTWYIKTKYNNHDEFWQKLTAEDNYIAFNDNSKTMTMLRLTMRENGTAVKCMVFKGSMSFTGETISGLLLVHRNVVTMETYTGEMTTSIPLEHQSTPSASLTSSPLPTKTQDPNPGSINPCSGCTDSTVILVGWSLAAVSTCLFISLLLYVVVIKIRYKANQNSTRVVQTTQDEDAEAYKEMETQLHGQAASSGHKETAPSSYQELMFK